MKKNFNLSGEPKEKQEAKRAKKSFSFSQLLINSKNLRIYTAQRRTSQNPSFTGTSQLNGRAE